MNGAVMQIWFRNTESDAILEWVGSSESYQYSQYEMNHLALEAAHRIRDLGVSDEVPIELGGERGDVILTDGMIVRMLAAGNIPRYSMVERFFEYLGWYISRQEADRVVDGMSRLIEPRRIARTFNADDYQGHRMLIAECDDKTLWKLNHSDEWIQLPNIPDRKP